MNIRKHKCLTAVILIICMALFWTKEGVLAAESGNAPIQVTIESVSQEDSDTYNLEMEVYNGGKDISGILRLAIWDENKAVYDTPISLAEKSTKNCTVRIPRCSILDARCIVEVSFLDSDGKVLWKEQKNNIFFESDNLMPVGILSDSFRDLTYLDLGGESLYVMGDEYAVSTTELTQENLLEELNGLRYLVIDDYDTSSLSGEQISAIQTWVRNGGFLIIGTGEAGDSTFAGFDADFINVELDTTPSVQATAGDAAQAYQYEGYSSFLEKDVIFTALKFGYDYSTIYELDGEMKQEGDGSVIVLNLGLSDTEITEKTDINTLNLYAERLYENAMENSNYIMSSDYSLYSYEADEAFQSIEGKVKIVTGGLTFLVVLYVLCIGPLLYLVLKLVKKREYVWIVIPSIALLFLGIIYLNGRGKRIDGMTVQTVTVAKAGGSGLAKTIFSAYQGSPKEWRLSLSENVFAAGPSYEANYYYSSYSFDGGTYDRRILKGADGISVGYVPSGSFEPAVFTALSNNRETGSLDYHIDFSNPDHPQGTVTNLSGHDFSYVLVVNNDYSTVLENVKDGETADLSSADLDSASSPDDVLYEMERQYRRENFDKAKALAALFIGWGQVYEYDQTIVIGLVENYPSIVDEETNGNSLGCIYETGDK